jgi:hypothetical protein
MATFENLNTSDNLLQSASQEYNGSFKLEKGVLIFDGSNIASKNITRVSNYPVRLPNMISIRVIVISIIVLISSVALSQYMGREERGILILPILISLTIIIYGIIERSKNPQYGITLELASGYKRYFIHKQKEFIDRVYADFSEALKSNKDYSANFNIMGDYRPVTGTNVLSVDGGSTVGDIAGNTFDNTLAFQGNHGSPAGSNAININNGSVVADIENNTQTSSGNGGANTIQVSGSMAGNISGNNQTS